MKHSQNILCTLLGLAVLGARAQEVRISNGLNVSLDGPVHLVLNSMGLTNNGQFKAEDGKVIFTGTTNEGRSFIGGSSPLVFRHLTVDRTSGDLQLQTRIMVYGHLTMTQGNLDLNNYNIDLGNSGRIEGENRSARIMGKNGGFIKFTTDLNNPQMANPGNLGLQLTSNKNMGRTTITRGHIQQVNDKGELSIQRYYEIDPTFHSDLQAEVVASYLDVESANLNPNGIVLWGSKDGGRNWSSVRKMNNAYLLSEAGTAQPVRLTYFTRQSGEGLLDNSFIQLYPNPVRERFTLSYYSAVEEDIVVNLFSKSGQLLELKKIRVMPGLNKFEWNVGKYAAGTYQLNIMNKTGKNMMFMKE